MPDYPTSSDRLYATLDHYALLAPAALRAFADLAEVLIRADPSVRIGHAEFGGKFVIWRPENEEEAAERAGNERQLEEFHAARKAEREALADQLGLADLAELERAEQVVREQVPRRFS